MEDAGKEDLETVEDLSKCRVDPGKKNPEIRNAGSSAEQTFQGASDILIKSSHQGLSKKHGIQ